jgi:NAD(P)-dependent dehydrogenase (short-subunit alcohol dehydrogenase family)
MHWRQCLTARASGRRYWSAIRSGAGRQRLCGEVPDRVRHLVLADAAQGYGQAAPEQREQVWRSREQQMALGGEILAQTRAAKLLRPGARGEDIATVASGMRKLRPEGYLAAAWMLAHDDIHGWLKRYSGTFEVWCGEQDAITQPELVQGLALRYGMPFTAIPRPGTPAISITRRFLTNSFYALTKRCAMNAQIEGRVAVVTGGSSGIGFETLRLLLGEGRKWLSAAATRTGSPAPTRRCKTNIPTARFSPTAATC